MSGNGRGKGAPCKAVPWVRFLTGFELEVVNALADRRGGDVLPVGGSGDVLLLGDRQEEAERVEVEPPEHLVHVGLASAATR